MNRKPDGSLLSRDDLVGIAVAEGLATVEALAHRRAALHADAIFETELRSLTADVRLRMMGAGLLLLDTRPNLNA